MCSTLKSNEENASHAKKVLDRSEVTVGCSIAALIIERALLALSVDLSRAFVIDIARRLPRAMNAAGGLERARKTPCYIDLRHMEGSHACFAEADGTALDAPTSSFAHPTTPSADPKPEPRSERPTQASASTKPRLEPLGPARYRLQLTAGQQLHDKLQQARDLMRHELPNGDLAQIVERALDLLIADRKKRRFGVGRQPRMQKQNARKAGPGSRHIAHTVQREVVARDENQCTFVSPDGRRCAQRGWLELHHEEPFGRGGPSTTSNVRVLCRAHNQLLAERDYGRKFIQQRIEQAKQLRLSHQIELRRL